MNDLRNRARNALLGLAIGDAIGWPAMFHRARLLPPWTRRLRREMDAQREETGILSVPMPFSLNQPADVFQPGPTDDTEWAAWTMDNLLKHNCTLDKDWLTAAWLGLAHEGAQVRGWVSTVAALENLRRGLMPPSSGRDNPHFFDDGAACRAVPIGIACAGNPSLASAWAEIDASVTNFEDGILIACSVAGAVSVACAGGTPEEVVDVALAALPEDSWSQRSVAHALRICREDGSFIEIFPALHETLNREYSDGSVGPETLAITLAIVARLGRDFHSAIAYASAFAKGADSIPSLVGAIVGALTTQPLRLEKWESCLDSLHGICIPALAGRSYIHLLEDFIIACSSRESREV